MNPSCSSIRKHNSPPTHTHTPPHPSPLPKFWHHSKIKPICKQLEKTLENMENRFLFLAAAPNCLLSWFSHFSRSDFPLNPAFLAQLCSCTRRVGKNSLVQLGWSSIPKRMSWHSQSLPRIPVSLRKRPPFGDPIEFRFRSVFLLYPCTHPLAEPWEGQQFPSF